MRAEITMITIEQIKAARALLGWGQVELAKAAGISLPALGNLERGAVTPRLKTIQAIQGILEDSGVEFIEGPGVRRQRETLKIMMLEGEDAVEKLFEDFYDTLKKDGGTLMVRGVSDRKFMKAAHEPLTTFLKRVHRHKRIRSHLLVCEGDDCFVGKPDSTVYRWVDKDVFGLVPSYIYRDKYAVLLWGPPLRVVITQNPSLAETYRRQFEADWKRAQIPPSGLPYLWAAS